MSRPLWCLVCVSATACNAIFGLEQTTLVDSEQDSDMDGVVDLDDNCASAANADQADSDDDGRGDVCDGCDQCHACDRGDDHDEAGDRFADGCDNCPAIENPGQENADNDELGNVCDVSTAFERRLFFAGFGALGDDWLEGGARWLITNDDVGPAPETASGVLATLQHVGTAITNGERWVIEVGLVPPDIAHAHRLYVGDGGFCRLARQDADTWHLTATTTVGMPFTATFGSTIRLRLTPNGALGAQFVTCAIPDVTMTVDGIQELVYPLVPRLATSDRDVWFRYLDVIVE